MNNPIQLSHLFIDSAQSLIIKNRLDKNQIARKDNKLNQLSNYSSPQNWLILTGTCILSVILLLTSLQYKLSRRLSTVTKKNILLDKEIIALEKKQQVVQHKQQQQQKETVKEKYATSVLSAPSMPYHILKCIEASIPDNIYLEQVKIAKNKKKRTKRQLHIKGVSQQASAIMKFFIALKKEPFLRSFTIQSISQNKEQDYLFRLKGTLSNKYHIYDNKKQVPSHGKQ